MYSRNSYFRIRTFYPGVKGSIMLNMLLNFYHNFFVVRGLRPPPNKPSYIRCEGA